MSCAILTVRKASNSCTNFEIWRYHSPIQYRTKQSTNSVFYSEAYGRIVFVRDVFKYTNKHFLMCRALSYEICQFGSITLGRTPMDAYYNLTSLIEQRAIQRALRMQSNPNTKGLTTADIANQDSQLSNKSMIE